MATHQALFCVRSAGKLWKLSSGYSFFPFLQPGTLHHCFFLFLLELWPLSILYQSIKPTLARTYPLPSTVSPLQPRGIVYIDTQCASFSSCMHNFWESPMELLQSCTRPLILNVEKGRYTSPQAPLNERLRNTSNCVDNELHFVTACVINHNERRTCYDKLIGNFPELKRLCDLLVYSCLPLMMLKCRHGSISSYINPFNVNPAKWSACRPWRN